MQGFTLRLGQYVTLIEDYLAKAIPTAHPHHTLEEGMNYSLLAGGKRIRPVLTLATCEMLGGDVTKALPFAAAVEMVHTYSLIHDDLPAMDDDDYRRGKPTNHKVYGEATAILAGDGLLTLAFATIAQADLPHKTISKGVLALAQCAGVNGMVGGQALDIAENPTTLAELERIQSKKTGALIVAACQLGGIVAQGTPSQLEKITIYAQKLGRAFQIRDDILDELGDTETLGKPIGSDKGLQKHTFFTELGAEGAQAELEKLTRESIQAITSLQSPEFHIALATQLESREK